MSSEHVQFLVPFLYDGEYMVECSPGSNASDLTKKVHHVFDIMREDPARLRPRDVAAVVYDANSQLGKKDERMAHFQRVGSINHQLITTLLDKNVDLPLPSPEVGRAMGLVHDLSNAFALYSGPFNQEEKELSLYHLAVELKAPVIADAAQHNAYLEIADMIERGEGFATVGMFSEWSKIYKDTNPNNSHNTTTMVNRYGVCGGVDNDNVVFFPHLKDFLKNLILGVVPLAVADCLDDGKSNLVDLTTLKENFDLRMGDIVARNYHDRITAGKSPTAFGVALVEKGGLQRMKAYLDMVSGLLSSSL